jgi:hypothetical protein
MSAATLDLPPVRDAYMRTCGTILRLAQAEEIRRYHRRGRPVPDPNEALLRAVLTQIDLDPDSWDQSTWWSSSCGPRGCVGGWALHLAGITPPPVVGPGFIWLVATQTVLGLLPVEARYLTDPVNTRFDVDVVAAVILARCEP